jgi:hypothetical protein
MRLTPILPEDGAEAMVIEDEIGSIGAGATPTGGEAK